MAHSQHRSLVIAPILDSRTNEPIPIESLLLDIPPPLVWDTVYRRHRSPRVFWLWPSPSVNNLIWSLEWQHSLAGYHHWMSELGGLPAVGDHEQSGMIMVINQIFDSDDDNDSLNELYDYCQAGDLGWTSNETTDHDADGCQDAGEDADDDNDSVEDAIDAARGRSISDGPLTRPLTTTQTGCQDAGEDADDDNDSVEDAIDACATGDLGWTSNATTDHDSDGCQDAAEDTDDDNDGTSDDDDAFPLDATDLANDYDLDDIGDRGP